jgi:phage repressor protein C with HTH and peptisase S24 domain
MSERLGIDPEWLKTELAKPGRSQSALARFMKLSSAAIVNRMAQGTRDISAREADQIRAYLAATSGHRDPDEASPPTIANTPDLPEVDSARDYVSVEVLPTFAGMGGGGTGEGDAPSALVSRSLVEQELRARPEDLLLIDVRGDSMLDPATGKGFAHGDQLLVDRRDRNPRQPGPFALWYDDGYVVKNVEIIRAEGKLRIFSNNPAYSDDKVAPEDVNIMGRPVWFARRL